MIPHSPNKISNEEEEGTNSHGILLQNEKQEDYRIERKQKILSNLSKKTDLSIKQDFGTYRKR